MLPVISGAAAAAEYIVIGAVFPKSAASSRAAVETALWIVNDVHPPLPVLMGDGGGLERLDHARLRATFADASDPAQAETEAERLVAVEHAVALIGGASPADAAAIRQVAMRHGIPYLSVDRASGAVEGLTWGFNLGPSATMTAAALFTFLHDHESDLARPIRTLGLVYQDTPAGLAASDAQRKLADDAGLERVVQINLNPNAASLTAEAVSIAEKQPDALIATLSASNAVMLMRALADVHAATLVLAPGGGFLDARFPADAGPGAEGVFCADGLAPDAPTARPALASLLAAYQARTATVLDPAAAQIITTVLLLANVIDRAGSTKPIELRAALMASDTPGDKLPTAWQGIRFDDTGQNVLGTPAIRQIQGGVYRTVAPEALAVAKPIWK